MKPSSILRRLLMLLGIGPSFVVEEGSAGAANDDGEDDAPKDDGEGQDDGADGEDGEGAIDAAGEDDADEVLVTIGDQPAAQAEEEDQGRAPEWVRELRKSNRELVRRQRELEAENQRLKGAPGGQPATIVLGAKPTLAGCDYDEDKFDAALSAWHDRKRQIDQQAAEQERAQQQAQQAWQTKVEAYNAAKGKLKVRDFEDAEASVQETLSTVQHGIILNGADNPALLVYALGRNPKKAKELGAIADPVKFTFALAKLETQLKVTPRKSAPAPERTVRGSAPGASAVDSQLERLRAEAEKTGNFTKVHQYRQQLRAKRAA